MFLTCIKIGHTFPEKDYIRVQIHESLVIEKIPNLLYVLCFTMQHGTSKAFKLTRHSDNLKEELTGPQRTWKRSIFKYLSLFSLWEGGERIMVRVGGSALHSSLQAWAWVIREKLRLYRPCPFRIKCSHRSPEPIISNVAINYER